MEIEYKCLLSGCENNAKFVCDEDYCHRYCEDCIDIHSMDHGSKKITIQSITKKYKKILPKMQENLNKFKEDILESSNKLRKYVKECAQESLKALNTREKFIETRIKDLIRLDKLKKYSEELNSIFENDKLYEEITNQIKKFFEDKHVNII